MNLQNVKIKTKAFFGNHKTDIACYGGCLFIGIGAFLACKATLKVNEMAKEDTKKVEEIKKKYMIGTKIVKGKENKKNGDRGTDIKCARERIILSKEGSRALTHHYFTTGLKYCGTFAPAVGLILTGMAGNIWAHNKEKSDRIYFEGVAGGFMAMLSRYRAEMAKERGAEAEKKFYYGVKEEVKEEKDEKGKTKKVKEEGLPKDIDLSDFAKFFGQDYSTAATGYPEADLVFLKNVELSATRKLARDKWLTLNELYKMLELRDAAGQRYGVRGGNNIGWVYDPKNPEANKVDLNLYNLKKTNNMDYINGFNDVILVEPNVNCLDLSSALWGLDMKTPDPMTFCD